VWTPPLHFILSGTFEKKNSFSITLKMARALLVASALLLAVASASAAAPFDTMTDAIIAEKLGNLAAIAEFVGAADELKAAGAKVTVFAPTDAAFDKFAVSLGYKKAADLLKPQFIPLLRYVLANHITFAPVKSGELKDGQKIPVMSDRTLTVGLKGGAATVGGAKVAKADVLTKDGTLHVLDSVIVPPNVFKDIADAVEANPTWSSFGTMVSDFSPELKKAALDKETAGTVFIPNNKAIAEFLEQSNNTLASVKANKTLSRDALAVLAYHVVPGLAIDDPSLADGRVLKTALVIDKKARNLIVERQASADGKTAVKIVGDLGSAYLFGEGETYAGATTLYPVDGVLVPALGDKAKALSASVMDVLKAEGLTSFAKALEALKVDDEFSNPNFNGAVLAPTNAAIAAFAKSHGIAEGEFAQRPGLMRELVGFHILPDLSAQTSKIAEAGSLVIPSVAGDNVTFTTARGAKGLQVKGYHGATANLLDEYTAGRGKVYKVDSVLLPADVWPTCYDALKHFADAKKSTGKLSALKNAVDATPSVKKALSDPAFKGTVLAPGNEAFAALPDAAKKALAAPDGKKTLESVLLYHVLAEPMALPYKWPSNATESATLLKGRNLTLSRTKGPEAATSLGGETKLQIVAAPEKGSAGKPALGLEYNLFCSNAVLHAIDTVLLPKL
jgi:transforming growth factor-beta-induced protein